MFEEMTNASALSEKATFRNPEHWPVKKLLKKGVKYPNMTNMTTKNGRFCKNFVNGLAHTYGLPTDYGHTKSRSLILCSPNSNPNPIFSGLVFCRNNG